jgi:hypothetical protein
MRTTASPSQRIVSNTPLPPDVIDSPSFPVFLRLFPLWLASAGLYILLATRYEPARAEEFLLLWPALWVAYVLAIRETRTRSGPFLVFCVLATSAAFRASVLFTASGAPTEAQAAFLHAASPIQSAMELRPEYQRILSVAFDIGALALLPSLLRSLSLPAGLSLVYGWNPLLVMETAVHGRLETIPLFFLLLAFRMLQGKRGSLSALLYGVSLAGPPFLWATLPVAAGALRLRLLLSLVVGSAAWAPLVTARPVGELLGWPPSTSVGGSLMPALAALARLTVTRNLLAVYAACAGVFLAVALARTVALGRPGASPPREALRLLGLCLFLLPEVLPWAYLPIAGLAAFGANPGWIVATATAPLTYLALSGNGWSFWLAFGQYFPVYASLGFVALGTKRRPGKAAKRASPGRS